jgi:hypothetical protein
MMKKIIAVACVAVAGMLSGQANAYTLTQTDGGNGAVQILPDGFTLFGTDFSDDANTGSFQAYYTQSFAVDTLISFNWSYATNDFNTTVLGLPGQDPAGYTLWSAPSTAFAGTTALSGDADVTPSGSVTNLHVAAGESFGWFVSSADGLNGGASLTISNLVETPVVAVPEPTGLALMLAGVGVLGLCKRSRKQAK